MDFKKLFLMNLLFFSSFAFGRNLRIHNPYNKIMLIDIPSEQNALYIQPKNHIDTTIADNEIIFDVYLLQHIWAPPQKKHTITIQAGTQKLEIGPKDFYVRPKEELITMETF